MSDCTAQLSVKGAKCESFQERTMGSIHKGMLHWESKFELDNFTRVVLKEGYRVPVADHFPKDAYEERDNKSARDNYDFVRLELQKLVDSGRVVETRPKPKCMNPLSVASKLKAEGKKKLRLVLDLSRKVNLAVEKDPFRMATIRDALDTIREGDYQLIFDLSAAYHHIALNPASYELMGFQVKWKCGAVKYYYFVVLPFGYRRASQVLGRIVQPVCTFLAGEGVEFMIYIDDGWVLGSTKEIAAQKYTLTIDNFVQAGFVIAEEKSHKSCEATRQARYLGLIIDSEHEEMRVWAPEEKLRALKAGLTGLAGIRKHKIRKVSAVLGQASALETALGPSVRLGLRIVQIQVAENSSEYGWDGFLRLSDVSIKCLKDTS